MKRILFALIIMVCACTSVYAQNSSSNHRVMTECLKFRGVPMDQSVQDLAEVLVNKGYKYVEYEQWDQRWFTWPKEILGRQISLNDSPNVAKVLSGKYAEYEDCHIIVSECSIEKHEVENEKVINRLLPKRTMVRVILPESDNLFALYQEYRDLDKELSLKYESEGELLEDNYKDIQKEYKGSVIFWQGYFAEYGSIELTLQKLDNDKATIAVTYFDNYSFASTNFFKEKF